MYVGLKLTSLLDKIYIIQCAYIGQKFCIWATLGYFLLNQFLPKKAASTQFVVGILRFQMWFDVNV
jgi:hypothetical protein